MRRTGLGGRLWGGAVILGYIVWAILFLPRLTGQELLFAAIGCPLFFIFYLVPMIVFGARVELTETGLRVQQYGETIVPYADVLKCYSLFMIPFQMLLIVTRESLPRKFLYCSDRLTEPRKSLMQDGEIASALRARIRRTKLASEGF